MPTPDESPAAGDHAGPIAPHLAEELWEQLGGELEPVHHASWPTFDPEKLATDRWRSRSRRKLWATISLERGASEEVAGRWWSDQSVQRHIGEGSIRKTIHVPDRMLNLVVTS